MKFKWKPLVAAAALSVGSAAVLAGPVIIDGTDANEHGSVSGGANISGWLYMQRALENLAATVSPSAAKVVVDLGTSGSSAGAAILSAFNLSSLPSSGWTLVNVDGAVAIAAHLASLSTANTGILYIPTFGNAGGDLTSAEMAAINAGAISINTFVGGAGTPLNGGGLFSQGESGVGAYGWLTTLIPGIIATDVGGGGIGSDITLTPAGSTAFAGGLTSGDLAGADPWHGYFSGDLGGLSVLGVALQGTASRNVIIGGGAGTVIGCGQPGQAACPNNVPEPETLPLVLIAGLAMLFNGLRRRRTR